MEVHIDWNSCGHGLLGLLFIQAIADSADDEVCVSVVRLTDRYYKQLGVMLWLWPLHFALRAYHNDAS